MTTDQTTAPTVPAPLAEVRNDMSHQLRATWVVTRRELLRFKQDKARMVTMLLQPVLFIFVMGTGLGSIVDTGGGTDFRTFLYPGVLATSVLFTAAFAGISLVWDREFGFLREMMVAPISRASIIWGKCLGGAIVATVQSLVLLALLGTVGIPYSPALIVELIGCLFLGALLLTGLGVLLSTRIKTIQAAMREGQVTLAVPDGASVVPRLFTELGVGIRAVTVTRPSLDDVFLAYTGRTIRDSEGPQGSVHPFAGRR